MTETFAASIKATSVEELRRAIAENPAQIPKTERGRENRERERWIADRVSVLMAESGELQFPLSRELGNNPDCVLISAGTQIGLEISEVVPFWLRRVRELDEELGTKARIDLSRFDWDARWTRDEMIAYLEAGATPVGRERGFTGSHDAGIASAVNERLQAKTIALNAIDGGKQRYSHHSQNWLALYVSYPVGADPHEIARRLTPPKDCEGQVKFDRVLMLLGDSYLVSWPPVSIRVARSGSALDR